eukprot:CAMPEP_0170470626 /NCGR_PEP_ID=MMETSP0123-20130129/13032_1 /TAXON_ID=182087 /ORGANISM="Favella ehrenbergii, Strain Fehren 1" /LENGTH=127 /DNA_ID=CAMNT_0010737835 /DNA_START=1137 /DNA_END=1516 /DNA_ORIENTATION=-
MGFLQVTESFIILHKPVELDDLEALGLVLLADHLSLDVVEQDLGRGVELHSTPCTFLVLLEDHVRDHLQLGHSLELQLLLELFVSERRHREVVVLAIGASEVDLLVFLAATLDSSAQALDYYGILWS